MAEKKFKKRPRLLKEEKQKRRPPKKPNTKIFDL